MAHVDTVLHMLPSLVKSGFESRCLPLGLLVIGLDGSDRSFGLFNLVLLFSYLTSKRIDLVLKRQSVRLLLLIRAFHSCYFYRGSY